MFRLKLSLFRWIWGLIPLLLIGWWINTTERTRIQSDLAERTQWVLNESGHKWAKVTFDGREGILSGTANSKADQKAAMKLAEKMWGVRGIAERVKVQAVVKPYTWWATRDNNKIKLRGHVPSEDARKNIVSRVQAILPNAKISDKMKLAAGAPARDVWMSGVSFALQQIARLKSGSIVRLEDAKLSVIGAGKSADLYAKVKTALAQSIPNGLRLEKDGVTPARVSPYTFSAITKDRNLFLQGYVPNEKVRQHILASAKKHFPKRTVIDSLKIGAGAPAGLAKAIKTAFAATAGLTAARVKIKDGSLTLSGLAPHKPAAKLASARLSKGMPKGFKLLDKTAWTVVDPYSFSARHGKGQVILSGHIPNEATRKSLIADVKKLFPGAKVRDKMNIASGNYGADQWRSGLKYMLGKLASLRRGTVSIVNSALTITGKAETLSAHTSLKAGLAGSAPKGFAWSKISLFKPEVKISSIDHGKRRAAERQLMMEWRARRHKARVAKSAGARQAVSKDLAKRRAAVRQLMAEAKARRFRMRAAEIAVQKAARRKAALAAAHQLGIRRAAEKQLRQEARARHAAQKRAARIAAHEKRRMAIAAEKKNARLAALAADKKRTEALLKSKAIVAANICEKLLNHLSTTRTIQFKTAKAALNSTSFSVLDKILNVANRCPKTKIEIAGHTDSDGSDRFNLSLSKARAASVVSYLAKKGLSRSRLKSAGYGETVPIAPNDTPANKAKNRRIEFKVY